ncbi:MAG: hypothetical protein PUG60_10610 [Lachnospiraceae bacterium]|nr:hypothetical protein [Lachnospiraceae bacterium]MDY4969390.1 hypothetical protein [Lachnospiraceae bacterium]
MIPADIHGRNPVAKGKSVDRDSADEQETDSEPGLVEAGGFSICRITPELQAEKAGHSILCDAQAVPESLR